MKLQKHWTWRFKTRTLAVLIFGMFVATGLGANYFTGYGWVG